MRRSPLLALVSVLAPAASGERNLVMGDFNTDPVRAAEFNPSAAALLEHVGEGKRFHFVTAVGEEAPPTYAGLFNIDHVISDAFTGACWAAGVAEGHPPVTDPVCFDHTPQVCAVEAR
jgi:endonuclease/exonuclease/phosphatase family metal-dependent hydrolase